MGKRFSSESHAGRSVVKQIRLQYMNKPIISQPCKEFPDERVCPPAGTISFRDLPMKTYLTTAIDYANGSPHLGHAYEKVLTGESLDEQTSWVPVKFVTGLDEHGQKYSKGSKRGIEPIERCNRIAEEFQSMLK